MAGLGRCFGWIIFDINGVAIWLTTDIAKGARIAVVTLHAQPFFNEFNFLSKISTAKPGNSQKKVSATSGE
jgi:hypothetical protein